MTTAVQGGRLLRLLGVTFGVAVILGGTLGVGILRTPGEVAGHLGQPWMILLAWMLGGVYSMLGAMPVTELGAALPQAGGFYVYVRRAFGDRAGLAIGWCDFLGQLAAVAFAALAMGEYAGELIPALRPLAPAVAVASIATFAAVHWAGLAVSAKTQEWTSALKAAAFLGVAAAAFWYGGGAAAPRSEPAPLPGLTGLVLAAQAVFYTYDGWYTAIYFTEEDRAPGRNLPRSIAGGVLAVTLIYVLMNVAFLYVLPVQDLAGSKLAAATAAERLFGVQGSRFVMALCLISLPPLINAVLLMGTRILYGLGRDGLIGGGMDRVSEGGTPRRAMLVCCGAAILMVLTGTAGRLLAIAGFYYVVNYSSAYVCMLALRQKEPALHRPFRAWGHPWTTGVVLLISLAFLAGAIAADWQNSLWALALLAGSEAVRLTKRPARQPQHG